MLIQTLFATLANIGYSSDDVRDRASQSRSLLLSLAVTRREFVAFDRYDRETNRLDVIPRAPLRDCRSPRPSLKRKGQERQRWKEGIAACPRSTAVARASRDV